MDELFHQLVDVRDSFWCVSRNKILLGWVDAEPVLDVGCGIGDITRSLMDKGLDTYSVDSSKKACELVSKINPKTRCIDITRIDGKDYPEFKTILVIDVLEHIKDDKKALEKIRNLLGEKGRLVLSVPYHQLLWNKTDKYHYRRYSRKQLRKILEESGFTVKKMRLWNMLSLLPLILSKIFSFEVSHKKLAHSKINRLLTWYFIHFENKIPLPLGSQLFCLAEKR